MKKIISLCVISCSALFLSGCSDSITASTTTSTSIVAQETCGTRAKAFFDDNYPGVVRDSNYYTNHYNKKLDKCYILVTTYRGGTAGYVSGESLYNVLENKLVGDLMSLNSEKPYTCFVGEGRCKNTEEWEKLIKPYMEE